MKKMSCFLLRFWVVLGFFSLGYCEQEISERGYWIGDVEEWHYTDWQLARAMVEFLKKEKAQTVVDFGCGKGEYVSYFLENGFESIGYDGNPNTPILTKGVGEVLDLSQSFDLEKTFDWVVCLEVGEHLPHQYEGILIDNLMRHTKKGMILSWAVKKQGGTGHFNEQDNDYIKAIFALHGYDNDEEAETYLRQKAAAGWFHNTIMVFRKIY
jgi:cyclopropane fatty-acyl-phospholipid synthase-like methyltransferase